MEIVNNEVQEAVALGVQIVREFREMVEKKQISPLAFDAIITGATVVGLIEKGDIEGLGRYHQDCLKRAKIKMGV
ncbi:hypothetical protein KKB40_00920 [Patescibacteria group bacterium]|nr:hypothetical protein [Patescibacteria group bacterium]